VGEGLPDWQYQPRRNVHQVRKTSCEVSVSSQHCQIEFEKEADLEVIKEIWSNTDDLILLDKPEESLYPTPLEITGKDPVYVGRVRQDNSNPKAINCWIVSDNLRIGAALNTVRIGEELVKILDSKTCNI